MGLEDSNQLHERLVLVRYEMDTHFKGQLWQGSIACYSKGIAGIIARKAS